MGGTYAIEDGPAKATCSGAVPADLAREWLRSCARWHGPGRRPVPAMPLKEDLALVASPLGELVAKRERARDVKGLFQALGMRQGRCARAFDDGRAVAALGLRTPEPLALLERSLGRVEREAHLLMRYVEGDGPWAFLADPPRRHRRDELLGELAGGVATLHGAGFGHRDLKAPNLLVRAGADGAAQVWFLDLDGLERSRGPVPRDIAERDLGRLCVSFQSTAARDAGVEPEHWHRLCREYLTAARGDEPRTEDVVALVRETVRRAALKIERNRLLGRPIA